MGNSNDAMLYRSARNGDVEAVRAALKKGASPNQSQLINVPHGWGPLHVAANYNKMDVCRLLMQRGADVSAPDKLGMTPLDIAARRDPKVKASLEKVQQEVGAGGGALLSPASKGPSKPKVISASIAPKKPKALETRPAARPPVGIPKRRSNSRGAIPPAAEVDGNESSVNDADNESVQGMPQGSVVQLDTQRTGGTADSGGETQPSGGGSQQEVDLESLADIAVITSPAAAELRSSENEYGDEGALDSEALASPQDGELASPTSQVTGASGGNAEESGQAAVEAEDAAPEAENDAVDEAGASSAEEEEAAAPEEEASAPEEEASAPEEEASAPEEEAVQEQ